MIYVTNSKIGENFDHYRLAAKQQPVRVTSNDQADVVILTVERYEQLVAAAVHIPALHRGSEAA